MAINLDAAIGILDSWMEEQDSETGDTRLGSSLLLALSAILQLDQAQTLQTELLERLMATQPSSPDTTPPADDRSGESIGSVTYFLARVDRPGLSGLMGMVTFHAPNSPWTHGDELSSLRDGSYRLLTLTESVSLSRSGLESSTPEAAAAGQAVSTPEASE